MRFLHRINRSRQLLIAGYFLALVLLAAMCVQSHEEQPMSGVIHYSGRKFAGSETCAACHDEIAANHAGTPHFLTSRLADTTSVHGSFDSLHNEFVLSERAEVLMRKTPEGLFQVAMIDGREVNRKRMDIAIGSGRKGQTYLYWDSAALYQLPVSYYAPLDTWSNSPGFPRDQIIFNRNIQARCLECHSTFFRTEKAMMDRELFDRQQVILGVDCERCHGPAADHVSFHRRHPGEKVARYVVNPADLTRQQRLDNCALCHSGIRQNFMPSFTFTVGDRLDDFSSPVQAPDGPAGLDVHGNQYGLLSASACFRMSEMDCSSCHNVHAAESGKLELFSQRCMTCHAPEGNRFCKQPAIAGLELTKNCIDCHMPALPSSKVFLQGPDSFKTTPFLVRTHLIGSYDKEIRDFLKNISDE